MKHFTYYCHGPDCPRSVVVEIDGPVTGAELAQKFMEKDWLTTLPMDKERYDKPMPTDVFGQPMLNIFDDLFCSEDCCEQYWEADWSEEEEEEEYAK